MRKNIRIRGISVCLLVFNLLFLSESLATVCQTNADCVLVSADCCGCKANGKSTAVHKSQEAAHSSALQQYCSSRQTHCNMAFICDNIQVKCENSQCVAVGSKTVPVADSVFIGNSPGTVTPLSNTGGGTSRLTEIKYRPSGKENQERIDSATKKIDKQRKFLGFSALANVAVGAYLLNRQCNPSPFPKPNPHSDGPCKAIPDVAGKFHCTYALGGMIGGPPNTIHGCILGPLALAQGIIHLKQRRSLKKTKKKLEGVTTGIDGSALYAGNVDGVGGTDGVYPASTPLDAEEPFHIPDLEVPCANDPTQTCRLTNDGETMVPLNGGPPQPLSEIAGNLPTSSDDPLEQADIDARMQAMEEAIRANQELITQADNANPNNGDDFQSVAGNDPTPAFNFDPLNTGSGSGSGSGTGAGSISGLSGFDDAGGNTPELPAPPEGVYGQDRDFSGSQAFAGNIEGESAADDDSDVDGNSAQFAAYGRRTVSGGGGNNSSNNERSLLFGADRVATAETNIFGAIHDRYQEFRDRGQFIPPSTSGAVVTPTIPLGAE